MPEQVQTQVSVKSYLLLITSKSLKYVRANCNPIRQKPGWSMSRGDVVFLKGHPCTLTTTSIDVGRRKIVLKGSSYNDNEEYEERVAGDDQVEIFSSVPDYFTGHLVQLFPNHGLHWADTVDSKVSIGETSIKLDEVGVGRPGKVFQVPNDYMTEGIRRYSSMVREISERFR